MDGRQELLILIDVLAQVISVVNVSSVGDPMEREMKTDAHNLANRFFQYAMTLLHLSNDGNTVTLPSFGYIGVLDPASIDVLARASMEAFLVFHHVFYSPVPIAEKQFRYWIYKAIGLAERQDLPEGVFEQEKQKAEEKKRIESIIENLKSNTIFKTLAPKQKMGIAAGRQRDLWRWNPETKRILSWSGIATDAGLSEMLAHHMYGYLSGHAHSGSISVLQTQQAVVRGEVDKLVNPSLDTMKILNAHMISEYTATFEEAHDKLDLTGAVKLVEMWVHIGRTLGDNRQDGP